MKTITSFLLATLLLIMSVFLIGSAISTLTLTTSNYISTQSTHTYDFTLPLLLYAIVKATLGILIASKSVQLYQISNKYYNKYLNTKRDSDIRKGILADKYRDLELKLKNSKSDEETNLIMKDFYTNIKVSEIDHSITLNNLRRRLEEVFNK